MPRRRRCSVPAPVAPGARAQLETLAKDPFVSMRVEGPLHSHAPGGVRVPARPSGFCEPRDAGARTGSLPDLAGERRPLARRRVGDAGHVRGGLRGARTAPLPRPRRVRAALSPRAARGGRGHVRVRTSSTDPDGRTRRSKPGHGVSADRQPVPARARQASPPRSSRPRPTRRRASSSGSSPASAGRSRRIRGEVCLRR